MGLLKNVCEIVLVLIGIINGNKAVTGPTHGKVVVCYFGTWSVYRLERGAFTIEHLDPTLCTHLIYSFAGLDAPTDQLKSLDPFQDLTENYGKGGYKKFTSLKQRYPHLKVSLAIGGWNEGSANYSALAREPRRRSRFVASAVQFLREYNFDGLDLDWEFPGKRGGSPDDKQNFVLLVKELRAAFDKHNYLLTAAFGAGKDTIDVSYDVSGLAIYLDFIHMMCYDYHGAWDQKTGANAPLRSTDVLNVEYTINYMLKLGAPPEKLVLGVPLYGRTFLTTRVYYPDSDRKPQLGALARNIGFQGPFTRENGFMGYNEICLELKNNTQNWEIFWDNKSMTPFAVSSNKVITFDDVKSIGEKVKFAIKKNLAGIMVWSVDTDDFHGDCADTNDEGHFENFPLMRAINKAIENALNGHEEKENENENENEIENEVEEKENENSIIHGNAERTSGATDRSNALALFVFIVFCRFYL